MKQACSDYKSKVSSRAQAEQVTAFLQFKVNNQVLFDIVKDKSVLEDDQKLFLEDQAGQRTKTISEFLLDREVNGRPDAQNRPEENVPMDTANSSNENQLEDDESSESSDEELRDEAADDHMYRVLRGGKRKRIDLEETNGDLDFTEIPLRRGSKVFSKECIEAIVKMNVNCNMSINQARKSFVITENTFNHQNYILEPENKPTDMPRTQEDFEQYRNVIPSEKTIWYHRHHYALSK